MKNFVDSLEKIVFNINKAFAVVSSLLVFFLMLLTVVDVAGRAFARPVLGTHELTYLMLALLVILSLGYAQSTKEHIAIDILAEKFPIRVQAIVDTIIYLVMTIVLSTMFWQMIVYANRTQTAVSGELGLPIYLFIYICAFGVLMYAITCIVDLLKAAAKAVSPNK